jgi:hypothetical protein
VAGGFAEEMMNKGGDGRNAAQLSISLHMYEGAHECAPYEKRANPL